MIETVLYFALGFFAAALLALMVSPLFWNRAVVLTKRRIENSVPLSLNEIQADKDQLRAEFAMSTRRLELSIDELKEKAALQTIEIGRRRDEMAALSEETREKLTLIEELEVRSSELGEQLQRREEALDKANLELADAQGKLEDKALEFDKMQVEMAETKLQSESRNIELVAKKTSVDDLKAQLEERDKQIAELKDAVKSAQNEARKSKKSTDGKARTQEEKIKRVEDKNTDLSTQLEKTQRRLSEQRNAKKKREQSADELNRALSEERTRTDTLEAELARSALRTEALLQDASNENVRAAMTGLRNQQKVLDNKLAQITDERDRLLKEIEAYQIASHVGWDAERKDNTLLREQINDLAAQITALTAEFEGPASPVNKILAASKSKNGKTATKRKAVKTPAGENGEILALSLAERIQSMQDTQRLN